MVDVGQVKSCDEGGSEYRHMAHLIKSMMSRGGAVGIVTGYELDDRGIGVRVPVE
jgi:hypothetical protein